MYRTPFPAFFRLCSIANLPMPVPPITLRRWTLADLESLVRYANNPRIAAWLTDTFPYPYLESHGRAFIAQSTGQHPPQIFAIDREGEAIGSVGIYPKENIFCKNAELGYWLAEPFWGQGLMVEAVRQIVAYGWATFDLHRLYARPFGDNTGSIRVLQKAGFVQEGHLRESIWKNGRYHDELIFSLLRPEP